jgi:hypothetical protein
LFRIFEYKDYNNPNLIHTLADSLYSMTPTRVVDISKNSTVAETSWDVEFNSDGETLLEPSRAKPRSTGFSQTGKENIAE